MADQSSSGNAGTAALSVVVPVHNEADNIEPLVSEIAGADHQGRHEAVQMIESGKAQEIVPGEDLEPAARIRGLVPEQPTPDGVGDAGSKLMVCGNRASRRDTARPS